MLHGYCAARAIRLQVRRLVPAIAFRDRLGNVENARRQDVITGHTSERHALLCFWHQRPVEHHGTYSREKEGKSEVGYNYQCNALSPQVA